MIVAKSWFVSSVNLFVTNWRWEISTSRVTSLKIDIFPDDDQRGRDLTTTSSLKLETWIALEVWLIIRHYILLRLLWYYFTQFTSHFVSLSPCCRYFDDNSIPIISTPIVYVSSRNLLLVLINDDRFTARGWEADSSPVPLSSYTLCRACRYLSLVLFTLLHLWRILDRSFIC